MSYFNFRFPNRTFRAYPNRNFQATAKSLRVARVQ